LFQRHILSDRPIAKGGGTFNPANYAITYVDGCLTITPAALTITANDATKTYGQTATFAGTEFTTSALQNGESVGSVTLSSLGAAATATLAGLPYAIAASAASGGTFNPANYTIAYVDGRLAIMLPAATVTASRVVLDSFGPVSLPEIRYPARPLSSRRSVSACSMRTRDLRRRLFASAAVTEQRNRVSPCINRGALLTWDRTLIAIPARFTSPNSHGKAHPGGRRNLFSYRCPLLGPRERQRFRDRHQSWRLSCKHCFRD
jgi:hypothetical protein